MKALHTERLHAPPAVIWMLPALLLMLFTAAVQAVLPPIEVDIVDAADVKRGRAQIYPNYIELEDAGGAFKGAVGVVSAQGRVQLFLVAADEQRRMIGWAQNNRLYNAKDELVGYYYWTPTWSYVYDPEKAELMVEHPE